MPPASAAGSDDPGPYGPQGRSAWLDVDWSRHQRWVTAAGGAVNVCEIGPADGPPIVWVHGLAGSWENWLENLPVLAKEGHRCVALDLPGFGHSPLPREPISISGYASILDEVMQALGLTAAVVVGNSMGGFIAAELAIRVPARVERLVLVSAAGLTVEHQGNPRAQWVLEHSDFALSAYAGWFASKSDLVARRARLRRATFAIVAAHPELLPGPLVAESLRGSGKPGFVPALAALTSYPIRARLPEIGCPTLIVWGARDHLVPVRDADDFARLIPDARKVVYADTGHVAMLERPAAFNALLRAFVDEEPNEPVAQLAVA